MCDMSEGATKAVDEETYVKARVKLYRYCLDATRMCKISVYENENLKNEIQKKEDRIKKLECEMASHKKALSDLKTSLTIKLCETEKQLKAKEEMCAKFLKENDKLKIISQDNGEKFTSLSDENKRLKEDVGHHKKTIEHMMEEAGLNEKKIQANMCSLTKEVQELRDTVQKSKPGLKLSLEWLLRFANGLLQMGCMTDNDEKAVAHYRDIYKNLDKLTEKECFSLCSEVSSAPFDAVHVPHISAMSPKPHSSVTSSNQAVVKIDVATSTTEFTKGHTIDEESVFQDEPVIHISSEDSDSDSSSSLCDSESEVQNFDFHTMPYFPSLEVGQKSYGNTDDPKYPLSSNKVTDKIPLFQPRCKKGSHQSLVSLHPGLNNIQNGSNIGEACTPKACVPKFTLSHTDENPALFISFPVTQTLKQQSVNLNFKGKRVIVGYKPFPSNTAKRSAGAASKASVSKKSKTTTDEHNGSYKHKTRTNKKTILRGKKARMQRKNKTASVTDSAQDCILMSAPVSDIFQTADAPTVEEDKVTRRVVKVLGNFEQLSYNKSLHTHLTESLRRALCVVLKANRTTQAVNCTVNFICSRTSNPLANFMQNKNESVLLPLDEHCVVKAYAMVNNAALYKELGDAIRTRLMTGLNEMRLLSLAALCRVFSTLQLVGQNVEAARHLCYDLLKETSDVSPYLVASVASVWSDVLAGLPTSGSGEFISIVVTYLTSTKPSGLDLEYWEQARSILQKYTYFSDVEVPEAIVELMFRAISLNNKVECFSDEDQFNYTTALELLSSRFDWSWIYENVMKKSIFPIIESYVADAHNKNSGVVGLCYKLVGVLALARDKDGMCLEFIKKTILKTLNHKVPRYILKVAYQAQYFLQQQCSEEIDEELQMWAKEHGLDTEEADCAEILS